VHTTATTPPPCPFLPTHLTPQPWEQDVTALLHPNSLKCKDLSVPDTPIPTAWSKEEYEAHSREYGQRRAQLRAENRPEYEVEALFRENRSYEVKLCANERFFGKVGAFEGAMYEAKGYYRPEVDCIMFTRSQTFCAVCRRAIERIIDSYSP